MADNSWVLVDDRDPGVAYSGPSGATIWQGGVSQEYCQTTTGLESGDTLTYLFNASSISVYGTYRPTGASGPPVAIYQVDNTPAVTFTAPITQSTLHRQNFWASPQLVSLAPGDFHTLVVTVPSNSTHWVDYLAYPAVEDSATSIAMPSSASASTSDSTPTPIFTQTTGVGIQSASSASISKTNTNIGATVAAVVETLASILAIAALVVYMRRRKVKLMSPPSYTSTSESLERFLDHSPRPLPPIPTRAFDGGVRLMGGPLEIPPEYQEHY